MTASTTAAPIRLVSTIAAVSMAETARDSSAPVCRSAFESRNCTSSGPTAPILEVGEARRGRAAAIESIVVDDEQILVQVTDRVMEITLNRPDRLNAWTPRMGQELIAAFDAADARRRGAGGDRHRCRPRVLRRG